MKIRNGEEVTFDQQHVRGMRELTAGHRPSYARQRSHTMLQPMLRDDQTFPTSHLRFIYTALLLRFEPVGSSSEIDHKWHRKLGRMLHFLPDQARHILQFFRRSFKNQLIMDLQEHPRFDVRTYEE